MRIRAKCPHCHGVLMFREEDAGKEVTCPRCKKPLTAPTMSSVPTSLPAREVKPPAASDAPAIRLFQEIEQEGVAAQPKVAPGAPAASGLGVAPAPPPQDWAEQSPVEEPGESLVWSPLTQRLASSAARRPPAVPTVVRVYGLLIMIVQGFGMAAGILWALINLPDIIEMAGAKGFYLLAISTAVSVGIAYFIYRVGKDMREGHRWAIVALSVLCGVVALQATLMWVMIGLFQPLATQGMSPEWAAQMAPVHARVAMIRVLFVGVACFVTFVATATYVPPLVSAYRHWEAFE